VSCVVLSSVVLSCVVLFVFHCDRNVESSVVVFDDVGPGLDVGLGTSFSFDLGLDIGLGPWFGFVLAILHARERQRLENTALNNKGVDVKNKR
jgi:hypothetical protein